MSSVRPVPETQCMSGEELSANDAIHTLRQYGSLTLIRQGFERFRYGDGFSHARAFALQLCLAVVPLVIAGAGLAADIGAEREGEVVARTVVALTPGSSDELVRQAVDVDEDSEDAGEGEESEEGDGDDAGELALLLGLASAFLAITTAFAQFERGANRIYGITRDRPAKHKYLRAALLALSAGVALSAGLLLIVAGRGFQDAVREVYDLQGAFVVEVFGVVRWPLGLLLMTTAVTLLFKFSPRRNQPGLTWLAFGAASAVVGWMLASGLLALYVARSEAFGATYGPLTAVMALLIWGNLTGIALLAGVAVAAQLEAVRSGVPEAVQDDTDDDGITDGDEGGIDEAKNEESSAEKRSTAR